MHQTWPAWSCYVPRPVLERAALHQTRFRTPGVTPDARGIVLGQRGLVLFPSLDRLVAFLRAYGEDGSLDELLPTMEIQRLITPLRTRELSLSIHAESSYRLDRVAGIARLTGGLTFTGSGRHYVKYRDATSPLGYDILELSEDSADLILYHDDFRQNYSLEREVPVRDLIFKLQPTRRPRAHDEPLPSRVWVTAELGVGHAILAYLFRWQIEARAAIAEWPPASAFDDRPRRLEVFSVNDAPTRIIELFAALPGVAVYAPLGPRVGVQLGYQHPVALDSAGSLFDEGALYLFQGSGEVLVCDPEPPFAPVGSLMRTPVDEAVAAEVSAGLGQDVHVMDLSLRLAPSQEPWRRVVGSFVTIQQREWLARLLYALPPRVLAALRVAETEEGFYLLDPEGIEGVPLGTFYSEIAPKIYVPAGLTLVPAVAPGVLTELVRDRGDGHVFFDALTGTPKVVAAESFGPVSRKLLREVAGLPVFAEPVRDEAAPLPLFEYGKPRRFPLWGLPKPSGESSDS